MGNVGETCCSKRANEGYDSSWNINGMRQHMSGKSLASFMHDYNVEKLQSNCNGGLVENYICQSIGGNVPGNKSKARLV